MADTPERRVIPGFVFDETKGRYFPVLPGHKAPLNYSYTEDAVKGQNELREKQKRDEEGKASRASLRSQRHERYLNNPGLGIFMLETGWGTPRDRMEIFTREFAASLKAGESHQLEDCYEIQKFCKDYKTGVVLMGAQGPSNMMGLCSTSLGGREGAAISLSKLLPKETYVTTGQLQSDCQVILCPDNQQSVWTSAVSRFDSSAAAGTSKGIITIRETPCQWGGQALELPSDVFAVEFLKPELLACGSRDSALRLIDTRMSTPHLNSDSSFAIRHPSSITHIRQINENDVIVCGLENSLCTYDLRWGHPKSPSKGFGKPSQPILEFVDHKNKFRLDLGFDIDVDHGIAAAATDDNNVQLFSLYTAKKIQSPVSSKLFAGLASCVQFAGVNDGKFRPPSLLVAVGNEFHEFSW